MSEQCVLYRGLLQLTDKSMVKANFAISSFAVASSALIFPQLFRLLLVFDSEASRKQAVPRLPLSFVGFRIGGRDRN